ncbi:unnamed protein product [Schistosoma margrebowiei]|uniref:Uncharacterized protein n=1 Tax=Schistosoma margrebowiei TaxID=48269 RepID=A0A183LTG3_9TREM|nr:unnamed protein product [Schistosoma margrebowiei]
MTLDNLGRNTSNNTKFTSLLQLCLAEKKLSCLYTCVFCESSSSCENSKQVNISEQKHEAVHGPLIITPSDVLIRLSEVRELSIVPVIRFDHPKQMQQVSLKHGSERITEVKKHGPSQDIVNTSKLSESANKRSDASLQCNESTGIASSSNSLDPCEDTGQLSEVMTNGFSKRKEIDQEFGNQSSLREGKNKVKEEVERLEEGEEKSNSSMKHLKFSENRPTTQINCNNSTDCNNRQSVQQNLQKQVSVEQNENNKAKPLSVHKTRRLMLIHYMERGKESHTTPELNETQNRCEKKDFNQPTSYQISHGIVPDMVCPNDSYISDEISCNFEEDFSEKQNHNVISCIMYSHFAFAKDEYQMSSIKISIQMISYQMLFLLIMKSRLMNTLVSVRNMSEMKSHSS